MKKKVKLFTTIASLCLAVALMAFGVYAARTITLTATGSITFEATDINGAWTQVVAAVSGGEFVTGENKTSQKLTVDGDTLTIPGVKVVAADTDEHPVVTITLTATFRNDSDNVAASLTSAKASEPTASNATVEVTGNTGTAAKTTTGTVVATIKLTVTNNYTVANASYSVTFTAVKAA